MSTTSQLSFPHIRVSGTPFERGRSYGSQARTRIARSIDAYSKVFAAGPALGWDTVRELSGPFEDAIDSFGHDYMEEVRGIASGAGVDVLDVIALNVRTEVMYSAEARAAAALRVGECSSYASVGPPGAPAATLVAQNWDWLVHCFDTVVILESERDDGPSFVTIVEAGLLAKAGMNAAGLVVATNALVTEADQGAVGVPYHVLLRALFDCESVVEALETVQRANRSSSANYLVAHEDGSVLDIEAAPGDFSKVYLLDGPGPYVHTNHFCSPRFDGRDVSVWSMPDSPVRLGRMQEACARGALDASSVMEMLRDHAGSPDSICCHSNLRHPLIEQAATVASLVMEPASRTIWLTDGQPCTHEYARLDYTELLKAPSTQR